jgi:hypothetical protein
MVCDELIATLKRHRADLDCMGVSRLAIFGSFARGEERPDSDVDILVDFNVPVSIFKFLDVKERLETLLGRSVDLVTRDALKPQLRDRILAEAVSAN